MKRRAWSNPEIRILREQAAAGRTPKEITDILEAYGFRRPRQSVASKRLELGFPLTRPSAPTINNYITYWPTRPARITDQLHQLAETPGLTPRAYEQERARILGGTP